MRSLFAVLLLFCSFAQAAPVKTAHVTAELVAENQAFKAGTENLVGVRLQMIPHWHTYWRFPGDSGLPTEIVWHLPSGWKAGTLRWPVPKRVFVAPLVNYGYEGEALIAAPISVPAGVRGKFPVSASVSWLVCKEECVPEKAELSLQIKVDSGVPKLGPLARVFGLLREDQPRNPPLQAQVIFKDKLLGIVLKDEHGEIGRGTDFLPLAPLVIKGDEPPKVEHKNGNAILWLEKSDPFDAKAAEIHGVMIRPINGPSRVTEISGALAGSGEPVSASAEEPESPAWLLVVFAVLGGLVLNLMPCVFPVLGIKVMQLVKQGGDDKGHARRHGLAYAAGVIVCFWVLAGILLALRSAGQAVGWGFQLQQPMFVTTLILLFTFVAADLAGFIQWSGRWMGAGSGLAAKDDHSGSFFTGALAVVVATPCSAPFMGTAIGAAIAEPWWVVFFVFTGLAFGLAIPFLLLCYQPGFLKVLPRPGAWMERLKELFAFPIAATVIWLLWVLTLQVGADGALKVETGLLVLMVSVWVRRRFDTGGGRFLSHAILFFGVLVCSWGAKTEAGGGMPVQGAWQPYSESALSKALDSGKPVFVDFTAAWCLTCQVNKKLVLDREATQTYFHDKGVVLLLADWTNKDPVIAAALERQGRIGVPLYLAYPAGSRRPEVLPQILTESRIHATFP
ncbi:MAG: protein-disulfide reductase DsbD family protein [Bdellovibrionota bacterium]